MLFHLLVNDRRGKSLRANPLSGYRVFLACECCKLLTADRIAFEGDLELAKPSVVLHDCQLLDRRRTLC